jgi:CheY-like chemotaxis protein
VIDEGKGMAPETLARLFEPFFQAKDDASDGSHGRGGLGVGMTLARSLVEMHAGVISAKSDGLGKGSEILVRLPLRMPRDHAASAARQGINPGTLRSPGARRILLVEDNPDFAYGLQLLLEDQGHQVSVAADGPAGLRTARASPPDVIVLDIGLPGMDGYEVARRVRDLPELKDVRLIALSGFGRGTDLTRSREAGVDVHLVKPVHLHELEAAMG